MSIPKGPDYLISRHPKNLKIDLFIRNQTQAEGVYQSNSSLNLGVSGPFPLLTVVEYVLVQLWRFPSPNLLYISLQTAIPNWTPRFPMLLSLGPFEYLQSVMISRSKDQAVVGRMVTILSSLAVVFPKRPGCVNDHGRHVLSLLSS